MADIENKLQKWGNSYGIVVPLEVMRRKKMKEGDKIKVIIIKKSNVLRETFGSHKFYKPIKELMKETDKELYYE